MGVRISSPTNVTLYCSVEGVAFGPVFSDEDEAEAFLDHIREEDPRDPREIPHAELMKLWADFSNAG